VPTMDGAALWKSKVLVESKASGLRCADPPVRLEWTW
jgi:hypothetical protein